LARQALCEWCARAGGHGRWSWSGLLPFTCCASGARRWSWSVVMVGPSPPPLLFKRCASGACGTRVPAVMVGGHGRASSLPLLFKRCASGARRWSWSGLFPAFAFLALCVWYTRGHDRSSSLPLLFKRCAGGARVSVGMIGPLPFLCFSSVVRAVRVVRACRWAWSGLFPSFAF
jgi:hypothetical protein